MTSAQPSPDIPAIEAVLPHRGTMLLLDRVVAYDKHVAIAEYTPRADAWYADSKGNMPGWIGIELMAQTIAAHVGLSKRDAGIPVKQGVLLGTRRYNIALDCFPPCKTLRIHASVSFVDDGGLGAYECRICSDSDHELAAAILKVYEPDDFDAFLKRSMNE